MPNFPLVDTHVHLWDPGRLSYPWLAKCPAINKLHLPADYDVACGDVVVEQMVFLQCECHPAQFQHETQWVSQLAERDPRIRGIVSKAPLDNGPAVRGELDQLVQNPLVKGVRRVIESEPDLGFCLQSDFIAGVQLLAEFDFSFDICISHVQMANTIKMVSKCPGVRFILDHIGKPDIKNHLLDPWRDEMRELALMENVHCKISGLATEADHDDWTAEDLRPYIDHAIDCFGFGRVMYGGDWPVATLATGYPRWVQTLDDAVADASPVERRQLFHDNAIAFYRL